MFYVNWKGTKGRTFPLISEIDSTDFLYCFSFPGYWGILGVQKGIEFVPSVLLHFCAKISSAKQNYEDLL